MLAQGVDLGAEIVGVIMPDQLPAELGVAVPVPILGVNWADDRETCRLAHDYLNGGIDGTSGEYRRCGSFRDDMCGGTGWKRPCLFCEPETSDGWKRALRESGVYLNAHASSDKISTRDVPSLLRELKALVEAGKLKAVIDRRYPWEQIVEAHRYVDQGHKKGNVVVTVARAD